MSNNAQTIESVYEFETTYFNTYDKIYNVDAGNEEESDFIDWIFFGQGARSYGIETINQNTQ